MNARCDKIRNKARVYNLKIFIRIQYGNSFHVYLGRWRGGLCEFDRLHFTY